MANIITAGMTRPISTASCSGPDGRRGACPVDLLHRVGAQLDETRIEPARIDAPQVPPLHGDAVGRGGARGGLARVGERLPQRLRARAPADRARSRTRPAPRSRSPVRPRRCRRCTPSPDGWRRVAPGDVAAGERRLGGGEERVAAHRDRRRSRVRGLADEPQHVALDAVGADHHAGGSAHRLEHRPLLDVQLEVRARRGAGRAPDAPRACGPDRRRSRRARPAAARPGGPPGLARCRARDSRSRPTSPAGCARNARPLRRRSPRRPA